MLPPLPSAQVVEVIARHEHDVQAGWRESGGGYSLEMSAEQLMKRMLCSVARVDLGKGRAGFMNNHEMSSLLAATTTLFETRIFIDDTPGLSILQLQANARRLRRNAA